MPIAIASQPVASHDLHVAEFNSFVRGYHAYKHIWNPVVGEMLILEKEPHNIADASAVAVKKGHKIVGRVPFNIGSVILIRDCNKGFVEVTGSEVNRGAGYGLEIPCVYRLYGPKAYTDRITEIVKSLQRNRLL